MNGPKKLKDVDSIRQTLILHNLLRTLPLLGLLGLVAGGLQGLFIGATVSVVVAYTTESFSGALGAGLVNLLFGLDRSTASVRERLAGDLSVARIHKMARRYDEALSSLDGILSKDPDFPEALFLRAQVLWEGFGDQEAAKSCLLKIIKVEPDKEAPFHRWALDFYHELKIV